MKNDFIPMIACRFKIRQDISCFIGFFQTRGVLIFNDVGASILEQINGVRTVDEIASNVKKLFPGIKDPRYEVKKVIQQLNKAGL